LSEQRYAGENITIGSGGSATVKLVKDPKTGKNIAAKIIRWGSYNEAHLLREIEALMVLNHPCVCRIIGWIPASETHEAEIHMEFAENRSLATVMERVRLGTRPSFWTATGKAIIISGIALAMRFVHSKGYIHRDLKPANVLINGRGQPLISDFGSVRPASYDATLTSEPGTVRYAAPELFKDETLRTEKVDVFSFGLIVYEILTGDAVFPASLTPFEVIRQLLRGERPTIPDSCGPFMKSVITECWSQRPENRPSFHRILERIQQEEFRILPRASQSTVKDFMAAIDLWEMNHRA
jgi:serine/threonine protein kinase